MSTSSRTTRSVRKNSNRGKFDFLLSSEDDDDISSTRSKKVNKTKTALSSASSPLDDEALQNRHHKHKHIKKFKLNTSTLRSGIVFVGFVCATFYFHMYLQQEYFRRCKSNVIRVVLFKQSHMCTHMSNVLNLIENTYFFGMKRIIDTVMLPLYHAGLSTAGQSPIS